MELSPASENGVCLNKILCTWMRKSPDFAEDMLKRVFLMQAFKIENQEAFVDALYGQGVLEELQLDLTHGQQESMALSAIRHAIVTSVSSRHVKELVVALEWSENEIVLENILKWALDCGKKTVMENQSTLSATALVPKRPTMTFESVLSCGRPLSQRERAIRFRSSWKYCGRFGLCRKCNQIMISFPSGHIRIYNGVDLHCQTVLPYYNQRSKVYYVQCTCSEIIVVYEDGSICSWNMQNGTLKARIWVRGSGGEDDLPFRMRLVNTRMVVATKEGTIQVWQYLDSTFTLLGQWHVTGILVCQIEFDTGYVILQDMYSFSIHVYFPNGEFVRMIQSNATAVAYQNGKLITGGEDQILKIWDAGTGTCLLKLESNEAIHSVAIVQKNIVVSGSHLSGVFTVWDMTKILGRRSRADEGDQGNAFPAAAIPFRKLMVSKNDVIHPVFLVGQNFIIGRIQSGFRVIEFA